MKIRLYSTFCLLAWAVAPAVAEDVALITQLKGSATLESPGVAKRPAAALLKLALGEKLNLAAGGQVQMVFLDNARQETWQGPAKISLGREQGFAEGKTPVVKTLPKTVAKQLAKSPGAGQQGRPGAVVVRSLATAASPEVAPGYEAEYRKLRAELPKGDPTPEIFYLNALIDAGRKDEARATLGELRRSLGDKAAKPLVDHFGPLCQDEKAR